jgi:ERCC4-related helicase
MDAQVDLNPHQVEAALFAFRSPLSTGAILADEVGLGKTIEAGLVISQKWAERKRKILVITPANLRKQWSQELSDKFYLPSTILETKSFNEQIQKSNFNPFEQIDNIIICSYQFARKHEAYLKAVKWDLVVVDEAHRLRNVYKPNNKIANSIKSAIANRPKILLTATPLQNSLLELFGLVSIIDDYTFGDIGSFKNQYLRSSNEAVFSELKDRLKPICIRTLRKQVLEYIRYTKRVSITQEFYPTVEEQELYDLVSEYLQSNKLYALPQSQRALMTLILRRLLASSTYAISGTLQGLAQKLDDIVTTHNQDLSAVENVVSENYEEYGELLDEWEEDEESTNDRKTFTSEEINDIKKESEKLKEFFQLAHSIHKNSKGEVLLTALKKGLAEAARFGAQRKAIIFTESTRTQRYLYDLLQQTEFSGKIVLFNGSNNDIQSRQVYNAWLNKYRGTDRISGSVTSDIRAALIDCFRDEAEIMIATEAGAEGVNLQFCSLVVNYDLPWNPQRIEQRIGRCHRYGQKYDVVVVNFINKANAADQRVFELLSEKFKLFEGVFGASDDILGAVENGIDFEKRIVAIYQTCRTESEINAAFDALQKTFEESIDQNIGITKKRLLENFDQDVIDKLRISMNSSKDFLDKYEKWLWSLTKYFLNSHATFDEDGLSFFLNDNPFPNESIHPGPYKVGKNITDVNTYRIGHPLAQRIIESCKQLETGVCGIEFELSTHAPKISILEELKGKSGYLSCKLLTIQSFETEDYVLLSGITNDGIQLDMDQCKKMFLLSGRVADQTSSVAADVNKRLEESFFAQQQNILEENTQRNGRFFDDELEKLEKWAEDLKSSIELELKDLDREIKTRKTEAKKLLNLDAKVKMQREIKDMETKRNELRRTLFQAQDDIDAKKDNLIENIEAKLKQQIEVIYLFSIIWEFQ